jgi:hypothetical protein
LGARCGGAFLTLMHPSIPRPRHCEVLFRSAHATMHWIACAGLALLAARHTGGHRRAARDREEWQ